MEPSDETSQTYTFDLSEQQEPTPEQDAARHEKDPSHYSLSVEAASQLFIQAGVPRSPRTVIRYCSNKTLDCMKVDTLQNLKYLVDPESVRNRIVELQQISVSSRGTTRPDISRHDATIDETRPDTSRHDATDENIQYLHGRVGELERENAELVKENRDLQITNRVKDSLLDRNEKMLTTARGQLMKFNRAIGELATRLRLKAPDQEDDTSRIIAYLDAPTGSGDQELENFVDA